ncbi:MAG: bifunctional pyr operon transcriptional regulator/uracil phosphoribosyltransferase PyrR [Lysobacterales bacterium]
MQLPPIEELLQRLVEGVRQLTPDAEPPLLVGIHTGGVWLAEHLRQALALDEEPGRLNISFYRDDFSRIGLHPVLRPSHIPWDIEGRHLLLVDDILYSGRTIRAALNELFDYGRPARVSLAVLATRSGRELPICADVSAIDLDLPAGQQLKLRGPDPLRLEIVQTGH